MNYRDFITTSPLKTAYYPLGDLKSRKIYYLQIVIYKTKIALAKEYFIYRL